MNQRIERTPKADAGARWAFSMYAAPATVFAHPEDVANDAGLSAAEKRAILASWVSDARAVEDAPELRQLDSGAVVRVDDVLRALQSLDATAEPKQPRWHLPMGRRRTSLARWLARATRLDGSNDNDDDPPPCPAGIALPFRKSFVAAQGGTAFGLRGAACATL